MSFRLRELIGTQAYVVFALCVAIVPILPYMFLGVPLGYCIALLIQRNRPIVVILRRFGNWTTDFRLMEKILAQVYVYARPVWLENLNANHPVIGVRRCNPASLFSLLSCPIAACVLIYYETPLTILESAMVSILVGIGSFLIMEAGVGNAPYPAFVFYFLAWLIVGSRYGMQFSEYLQIERNQLLLPLALTALVFLFISIRYRFSPRTRIGSIRRLKSLERFPNGLLGLRSRTLATAPAVVSRIEVKDVFWERAIQLYFNHAQYAIIDVTDLSSQTALEWEIEQVNELNIRVFYTCAKSNAYAAKAALEEILSCQSVAVFEYADGLDDEEFLKLAVSLQYHFNSTP